MHQERKPINRLNDVLMKYVFAREEQKAVTLSLINAVFAAENYTLLEDFQYKYHHAFAVQHTKHPEMHFTDDLEIHCLELPKFEQQRGDIASLNPLGKWLAYFSKKTPAADLEAIAMQDPMIHQAVEAEQRFMQNPDFVSAYDIAEKAERDRYAREQFVRDEGRAQGRIEGWKDGQAEGWQAGRAKGWEDGKADERREIAQNLLHLGLPIAQIAEATGLAPAEIEALRKVQ